MIARVRLVVCSEVGSVLRRSNVRTCMNTKVSSRLYVRHARLDLCGELDEGVGVRFKVRMWGGW
jgi:hypothetical protein